MSIKMCKIFFTEFMRLFIMIESCDCLSFKKIYFNLKKVLLLFF